jgi:hypothetical protein
MNIKVNREEVSIQVRMVTILLGDSEFTLQVNNLGELTINKMCFGEGSSTIQILPRVSNEIEIK